MTDDQRERLNRFLAEKVTQIYIPVGSDPRLLEEAWKDGDNIEWEPPNYVESWPDCEPLLDKIERDKWYWSLDNADDGGYGCHAWNHEDYGYGWSKSSRTEALCLAIARLYGWKEEG